MAFDYKKEYREFYLPPRTPGLIDVPQTRHIAVSGSGDPAFSEGFAPRANTLQSGGMEKMPLKKNG